MDTPVLAPKNTPKKYKNLGLSSAKYRSPDSDDASVDFSEIWTTIHRNKWLILLTCLLVTGAVTGYTLTLPKIYEATSIVSVEAKSNVQSASMWPMGERIDLSNEIGLLENSGELNQRVVDRLSAIADTVTGVRFTVFEPIEGEEPTALDVMSRLEEQTSFSGMDDESMIEIEATSESPEEATFIVDAYAHEYQHFSQEMARASVVAARKFLEEQVEKRKQEIENVEDEWEQFARTNNVATEGAGGERVADSYVELESQRNALEFELEQARGTKSILENQLEAMQPALRNTVLTEQRAQSLRTQIEALEKELAALELKAGQYYMNNPDLRGNEEQVPQLAELTRQIEGYEKQKAALTEKLVALTEEQGQMASGSEAVGANALGQVREIQSRIQEQNLTIRQLEGQIRGLNQRLSEYEGRVENIPRQTIRREQIQRRLAQAESFYQEIVKELQATILAEESELGYVNVVRAGIVPEVPVSPNIQRNIILGIILGLGFGIGLAFIMQSTDSRVYDPNDLQNHGYNLLGVIPTMDREIKDSFNGDETIEVVGKTLSTTLIPLLNPWSAVSENYRLLRTNLRHSGGDEDEDSAPEVLLITSPEAADGKTTTCVNLAITFALSGQKILLIDADLRKANGHNLLGLEGQPGLSDVLNGRISLDEARQSFMDGFEFVAAGETKSPPTEMLDSKRMRDVLEEARESADVVIIDTPPVLAAGDALVLAVQADANLVVADAGSTDRRALDQVEKMFGAVGASLSSVIFNRFDTKSSRYEYEYGYGSDYYEYDEERQRSKKSSSTDLAIKV